MAIKTHLDAQLQKLLAHHEKDDYILLDRGDGAAVCFLLEPETALYFALNLRDAVRKQEDSTVPYEIRIGINLGPIKIILDVNGDKTTLGEGINCAARIMDFAGAGQIYVSRSFFEVVGCLSEEYAELFSYRGKKADKHIREFELYEVAPAQASSKKPKPPVSNTTTESRTWDERALQSRVTRLSAEIGPMAGIVVQRAAQKASSLEELDELLTSSGIPIIAKESDIPTALEKNRFDAPFLVKAEHLLKQYLGPIAPVLIKQAVGRTADEAGVARLLADELANDTEKQAFLSALRQDVS